MYLSGLVNEYNTEANLGQSNVPCPHTGTAYHICILIARKKRSQGGRGTTGGVVIKWAWLVVLTWSSSLSTILLRVR